MIKLKNIIKETSALARWSDSKKIDVGDTVKSDVYLYRGKKGKVIDVKLKKINGRLTTVAVVNFGGKKIDHEIRRLQKV